MLEESRRVNLADADQATEATSIAELVEQVTGFVRRQFPVFLFVTAGIVGLGFAYLFTTPPKYTAHAMLLIDSSKARAFQQQQTVLGDIPLDTAQVETQVEVLKSENVGLSVVKEMHLTEAPDFVGSGGGGFIGAIFDFVFGSSEVTEPKSESEIARIALGRLLANRKVTRVARTYVLDISYTALSSGRAAEIANGIADAYIVDQLEAKYQTTRRASVWLQDRIKELRVQASDADRAVLEYKEKNNIVDTGPQNVSPNSQHMLLGDQQIADISTQLSQARGAKDEAKAKLDRIDEIMKQDIPDASVADSLHSEVIVRLRNDYLDKAAKERIWAARYGEQHLAAANLRIQMAEIRRSITDELRRIAESNKSDYEVASTRVTNLQASLAKLISESRITNRDRLGLRELESQAQVYHSIHDNFLTRYMEAIQQESFPITEARVISAASPPTQKSSPKTLVVLAVAGALGVMLSFGAAVLREAMDRVFRTQRQVEEQLHTNCLAVLPALKNIPSIVSQSSKNSGQETGRHKSHRKDGTIGGTREFLRYVVDEPLSSFTEAFRTIKVAADINRDIKENKVIGVTSTIPREGKSTVSSNLAQLIAHAGKRVILVDGDLRNPTLTRSVAKNANVGLLEVLSGKIDLTQAIITDKITGLAMLPVLIESRLLHTNEILASDAFKRLIDGLRRAYDYVIVDLPPLAPVVDVRATVNIIDSYLYVIEWGQTGINLVQHELAAVPEIHSRLLGVVLNKANVKVLERYEYYYGGHYHKKYYARYGYTS